MATVIDAIIQARLGSSRFPAKLLETIAGKPLLGHVIDRLKTSERIDRIIIATTQGADDDPIESFCTAENLLCYRGSTNRVLNRFLGASKAFNCNRFVRVCSDNPLIDIGLMDYQINEFKYDDDYCSFYTRLNEPLIIKPIGLFVECVKTTALELAAVRGSGDPRTQEHVTFYIHNHPDQFTIKRLSLPEYIDPELRFTIDYPEDVGIIKHVLKKTDNNVTAKNIMDLVKADQLLNRQIKGVAVKYPKKYTMKSPTCQKLDF